MKLNEDIFTDDLISNIELNAPIEVSETEITPDAPEASQNGEASVLIALINDEWEAIEGYNNALVNISDADIQEVLKNIVAEENNHVGMLQRALEKISPNAQVIDQGKVEAENIINENLQESKCPYLDLDDDEFYRVHDFVSLYDDNPTVVSDLKDIPETSKYKFSDSKNRDYYVDRDNNKIYMLVNESFNNLKELYSVCQDYEGHTTEQFTGTYEECEKWIKKASEELNELYGDEWPEFYIENANKVNEAYNSGDGRPYEPEHYYAIYMDDGENGPSEDDFYPVNMIKCYPAEITDIIDGYNNDFKHSHKIFSFTEVNKEEYEQYIDELMNDFDEYDDPRMYSNDQENEMNYFDNNYEESLNEDGAYKDHLTIIGQSDPEEYTVRGHKYSWVNDDIKDFLKWYGPNDGWIEDDAINEWVWTVAKYENMDAVDVSTHMMQRLQDLGYNIDFGNGGERLTYFPKRSLKDLDKLLKKIRTKREKNKK